jgi:hypothetical protein
MVIIGRGVEDLLDIFIDTLLLRWGRLGGPNGPSSEIACPDEEKHTHPFGKRPLIDYRTADPVSVPKLEALISQSHKDNEATLTQTLSIRYRILLLPLEIQLQILDELCLCELPVAVQALDWMIPKSYWRTRITRFPYFEVSSLEPNSNFDWEYFGLRIGPLLQTSPGLQNRQRIFRILEETKQGINQELDRLSTDDDDDDNDDDHDND